MKPAATSGSSKKKSKAKPKGEGGDPTSAGAAGDPNYFPEGGLETPVMTPQPHLPSESPKKPKGGSGGGGSGSSKKNSKAKAVDPPLPPVVMASA